MEHVIRNGRLILSGCLVLNDRKEVLLLYRADHGHYETPGGKVQLDECETPNQPTIDELAKTAQRELFEELGNQIEIDDLEYFGGVDFVIPDGRTATANKFITRIRSGEPIINEPKIFSKLDYLPIDQLDQHPISPDLKLLLPKLQAYVRSI